MMKRRFLLFLLLLLPVSLFAATPEGDGERLKLHFSSSLLMSSVGVSFEKGPDEWDLSFCSLYPNTFFLTAFQGKGMDENGECIRYDWKLLLEDTVDSLNNLYLLRGEFRHDVLESETYDLDLGVGLECGASLAFDDAVIFGAFLDTSIRLSHNYSNGSALFCNIEIPPFGIVKGKDRSGGWTEPVLTLAFPWVVGLYELFAGISLGYRMPL